MSQSKQSFVVLAPSSKCGAVTISATSADLAARLYTDSCIACEVGDQVWVWNESDYHRDSANRPEPFEFHSRDLLGEPSL